MKITPKQYAQSLNELVYDKNETEVLTVLKTFIDLLVKNNDYNKSDEIMMEFSNLWDENNGELAVALSSARTLGDDSKDIIAEYLKNKTGKNKINISENIDPEMMGGMVLRYGDKILDGSLKTNLNNLKEKITI